VDGNSRCNGEWKVCETETVDTKVTEAVTEDEERGEGAGRGKSAICKIVVVVVVVAAKATVGGQREISKATVGDRQ
jgi:hypothetical protein